MSKGEDKIVQILKKEHIRFTREKTFPDLTGRHNVPLRFDFYLPDYKIIIEYDGEAHFQAISKFGGRAGYMAAKERDRKKNSYCLTHHIPLFRIPYWELDNVTSVRELLKINYRVNNKFHNDLLKPPN